VTPDFPEFPTTFRRYSQGSQPANAAAGAIEALLKKARDVNVLGAI
jgi:hypothetical protein